MKKLALLLALCCLVTSLNIPVAADSSSDAGSSASASEAQSSKEDQKDESGGSGSETASSDNEKPDAAPPEASSSENGAAESAPEGASMILPRPPFASELLSQAYYMKNLDSNTPVFESNAQVRVFPASLTKIMTAVIVLENVKDLDNETTSLKAYIQNYLYNLGVDTLGGIALNEELCIRDLMYAMLIQSANETAMMLADYVGDGSIDYFCELMNAKAKELGAVNTHFSNPTGLDDENNYSTAYDFALIAEYAMKNPTFVEMVSTLRYTSKPTSRNPEGITWTSTNYMQNPANKDYYYEGLKGIKTGSLSDIHNFVSIATRDGYTYLLVVMGAPVYNAEGKKYTKNMAMVDSGLLYDWAFKTFTVKTLLQAGKEVTDVGVRLSWDHDRVKLLAKDKFATLVSNEMTETDLTSVEVFYNAGKRTVKGSKGGTEPCIDAPIKAGQEVGYTRLMLAGEEVGRVTLVAAEDVERSEWLYYLDVVKQFLDTFVFKFVVSFIVIVILLYIVLMMIRNHNRRRYRVRRKRPPQAGTKGTRLRR